MKYRQRQLGVVPSPQDYRDYPLTKVTAIRRSFPEQYTYPFLIPKPYDQGDIGACVPFSLKAIKEMQELQERSQFISLSAAYIYGARQSTDFQGEGMIPREALHNLRVRGNCREVMFPGIYPYAVCARSITEAMHQDALPQRIKTYASIHTVDEIKTALIELGPVAIGISVYDSFYQGGHLPLPDKSTEKLHGFHMVSIVGWTHDNRWLTLNSWGSEWGELKGYCTIPFNYTINERWALTDLVAREQTEYEVILSRAGRYWGVNFSPVFRTPDEAQKALLNPLQQDLIRCGKQLKIKKPRRIP